MSKVKTAVAIFMGVASFFIVNAPYITALQFLPFALYFILIALDYSGMVVDRWIYLLSSVMIIINSFLVFESVYAWLDIAAWSGVLLSYILSNES